MIRLNLLPPAEKENLKLAGAQRWVLFYGSAVSGIVLLLVVLLAGVWSFINIQISSYSFNVENTKTSFQGQSVKEQQNMVAGLNKKLGKIELVQKEHKFYSLILAHLASVVPSGARLEGLTINESNEAILSGFAPQREQVMEIKEKLEKSPYFENVVSPLSNLVRQNNIYFSFRFNVKPAALKGQ